MNRVDVFNYTCLREYFSDLLNAKKEYNSSYSLRAWSKSLGYNNPAFISQCLNGVRTINRELLSRVLETEKVEGVQELYLMALFYKHHANEKDLALFDSVLDLVKTGKTTLGFTDGKLQVDGSSLQL